MLGVSILSLSMMLFTGCGDIENTQTVDDAIENGGAYKENKESKDVLINIEESSSNKTDDSTKEPEELTIDDKSSPVVLSVNKTEAITDSFNKSLEKLDKVIHSNGGYIVSHEMTSPEENNRDSNREINMAIRVPKENLEDTLDFISNEFYIKSESSNTVDISKDYYDIDSEIESLNKQENRLNELIDNTNNLDEILKINDEIKKVSVEKKSLESSKMEMDYRANFSRINLDVEEVDKVPAKQELSSREKINEALTGLAYTVKDMSTKLAIALITLTPLIVIGAFAYLLYNKYGWIVKDKMLDNVEDEDKDDNK